MDVRGVSQNGGSVTCTRRERFLNKKRDGE